MNEFTGLLPKVAGTNAEAFHVARNVTAFADILPLLVLRVLDTANVRGPDVWGLFRNACGGDVRRFVLLVLQDPPAGPRGPGRSARPPTRLKRGAAERSLPDSPRRPPPPSPMKDA